MRGLRSLGIDLSGGTPSASGAYALQGERTYALPGGPISLLTTGLLRVAGKLELGRWLTQVAHVDSEALDRTSLERWLATTFRDPTARCLVQALVRLTSYANAPTVQSAGAHVRQLQAALSGNVRYIDGGWQTIVSALRDRVVAGGGRIESGRAVRAVRAQPEGFSVHLDDGHSLAAQDVVIAGGPDTVRNLLGSDEALDHWMGAPQPVLAACLDVGLRRLPRARATFALGIDRPLYFSVHSAAAHLCDDPQAAVVHVLSYLPPTSSIDSSAVEAELEGILDTLQPGWRALVSTKRFLPKMTVAPAVTATSAQGERGRPGVNIAGRPGLFAVGDWVGPEGMLADASFASAEAVAATIAASPRSRRQAA